MQRASGSVIVAALVVIASACASDDDGAEEAARESEPEVEIDAGDDAIENDLTDTDDGAIDDEDEFDPESEAADVADDPSTDDTDGEVSIDTDAAEEPMGSDSELDQADDKRLEATAAVFADFDGSGPGCVVGVARSADVQVLAFGLADIDSGEALTANSIFDIGSVSKQFTAGAVALLATDGALDLGDDISDVIDIEPFGVNITISDLVHHTSGLPDYTELLDAGDDELTTNDDVLDLVGAPDYLPAFDPGTEFEYSNTNYVLLSEIVADVSGQSLGDFSADRIFAPLQMSSSVVRDDQGDLLVGQAQGYADDGGVWVEAGSSWRQTGDGAIHGTIPDLLRWAQLFFPGATDLGGGLGSAAWLEQMLQPGEVGDGGSDYAFGIGIEDGGEILAHAGSWIGYSSALTMQPSLELAAAVSCNIDELDADGLSRDVLSIWASS